MAEPAMRASVERTFFGLLRELPTPMLERVETQCDPGHYRSVREAGILGWVPLSHVVGVRESLLRVVGDDDQFVALIKDWALLSVSRPPFNVMSAAILRIYDREPAALLRAYGRIWSSIYRDVGDYAAEPVGSHGARVVVHNPCPQARAPAFRLYNLGIFKAVVEIGEGTVATREHRIADGRVEFDLTWNA